jgi:hypothetical protein
VDACRAVHQADAVRRSAVVQVLVESGVQAGLIRLEFVVEGVGGGTGDGLHESRPVVAEGYVGEPGELLIGGQASDQGLLGLALLVTAAKGEATGELLGAGDAGSAVAPGGASWSRALEFAVSVFGSGDQVRPPGVLAGAVAPPVEPVGCPNGARM